MALIILRKAQTYGEAYLISGSNFIPQQPGLRHTRGFRPGAGLSDCSGNLLRVLSAMNFLLPSEGNSQFTVCCSSFGVSTLSSGSGAVPGFNEMWRMSLWSRMSCSLGLLSRPVSWETGSPKNWKSGFSKYMAKPSGSEVRGLLVAQQLVANFHLLPCTLTWVHSPKGFPFLWPDISFLPHLPKGPGSKRKKEQKGKRQIFTSLQVASPFPPSAWLWRGARHQARLLQLHPLPAREALTKQAG